jgi:hypothetical protein
VRASVRRYRRALGEETKELRGIDLLQERAPMLGLTGCQSKRRFACQTSNAITIITIYLNIYDFIINCFDALPEPLSTARL